MHRAVGVDKALMEFLTALMSQTGTQREMQTGVTPGRCTSKQRRLVAGVTSAWRAALDVAAIATPSGRPGFDLSFELVDDDVVENKILASRMALTVMERVSSHFESLRLRVRALEGRDVCHRHPASGNRCLENGGELGQGGLASGRSANHCGSVAA